MFSYVSFEHLWVFFRGCFFLTGDVSDYYGIFKTVIDIKILIIV